MNLFWQIETGALRLSSFGLAVVIVWLVFLRYNDARTGRHLRPGESPVQSLSPEMMCTMAALVALVQLLTTVAALWRFPDWLVDPQPVSSHMIQLPICVIAVIMILRIAYHPHVKRKWCAGWIGLAHLVQWGGFFLLVR
jgi:hypothetical protein